MDITVASSTEGNYELIFVLDTYTIFLELDNGGTVDPAGTNNEIDVNYGASLDLDITADARFAIYQIYLDEVLQQEFDYSASNSYAYTSTYTFSLTNIGSDHTVRIEFRQLNWINHTQTFTGMDEATGIQTYNGNSLDGRSVANAYIIQTPAQLARIAYLVNNGISSGAGTYASATYNVERLESSYVFNMSTYFWTPIGTDANAFTGTFFTNSNITFDGFNILAETDTEDAFTSEYVNYGVFGRLNYARITNIHLTNYNYNVDTPNQLLTNSNYIGGIVGYGGGGLELTLSSATGTIYSNIYYVGGLVGYMSSHSTILNDYASVDITSTRDGEAIIGGIIARTWIYARVENVYVSGTITYSGTNAYAKMGGIVGQNQGQFSKVYENVILTNTVGTTYVGAVIGQNHAVTANYAGIYDTIYYIYNAASQVQVEIGSPSTSVGGIQISQANKTTESYYEGFDFNNIWEMSISGPVLRAITYNSDTSSVLGAGSEEDPYQIANLQQLNFVRNQINDTGNATAQSTYNTSNVYYVLTQDITITNSAFVPFGVFNANLNGAGFSINGLYIVDVLTDYIGFVQRNYGTIENLNVNADYIIGINSVGGIVG